MWFVFLRPELCLRLPSDSISRWTPLPLACTWSLPTRRGDFHPRMRRHARRTSRWALRATKRPPCRCQTTRSVSRILSRVVIYLGPWLPKASSDRTRGGGGPPHVPPIRSCSGWGLPGQPVTWLPVRSYRTVSPLLSANPTLYGLNQTGERFNFCGTFLRVTPTGSYPAPSPMEFGLSSSAIPCDNTQWIGPRLPDLLV